MSVKRHRFNSPVTCISDTQIRPVGILTLPVDLGYGVLLYCDSSDLQSFGECTRSYTHFLRAYLHQTCAITMKLIVSSTNMTSVTSSWPLKMLRQTHNLRQLIVECHTSPSGRRVSRAKLHNGAIGALIDTIQRNKTTLREIDLPHNWLIHLPILCAITACPQLEHWAHDLSNLTVEHREYIYTELIRTCTRISHLSLDNVEEKLGSTLLRTVSSSLRFLSCNTQFLQEVVKGGGGGGSGGGRVLDTSDTVHFPVLDKLNIVTTYENLRILTAILNKTPKLQQLGVYEPENPDEDVSVDYPLDPWYSDTLEKVDYRLHISPPRLRMSHLKVLGIHNATVTVTTLVHILNHSPCLEKLLYHPEFSPTNDAIVTTMTSISDLPEPVILSPLKEFHCNKICFDFIPILIRQCPVLTNVTLISRIYVIPGYVAGVLLSHLSQLNYLRLGTRRRSTAPNNPLLPAPTIMLTKLLMDLKLWPPTSIPQKIIAAMTTTTTITTPTTTTAHTTDTDSIIAPSPPPPSPSPLILLGAISTVTRTVKETSDIVDLAVAFPSFTDITTTSRSNGVQSLAIGGAVACTDPVIFHSKIEWLFVDGIYDSTIARLQCPSLRTVQLWDTAALPSLSTFLSFAEKLNSLELCHTGAIPQDLSLPMFLNTLSIGGFTNDMLRIVLEVTQRLPQLDRFDFEQGENPPLSAIQFAMLAAHLPRSVSRLTIPAHSLTDSTISMMLSIIARLDNVTELILDEQDVDKITRVQDYLHELDYNATKIVFT